MAQKRVRVRFTVSAVERSALEIARAIRRLPWSNERKRVLRVALLLAGETLLADLDGLKER